MVVMEIKRENVNTFRGFGLAAGCGLLVNEGRRRERVRGAVRDGTPEVEAGVVMCRFIISIFCLLLCKSCSNPLVLDGT